MAERKVMALPAFFRKFIFFVLPEFFLLGTVNEGSEGFFGNIAKKIVFKNKVITAVKVPIMF